MSLKSFSFVAAFLMLTACSSFNSAPPKPVLGDIDVTSINTSSVADDTNPVDLIRSYKELLSSAQNEQHHNANTLKRLADLSSDKGVEDLLTEDDATISQGKVLSSEAIQYYHEYLDRYADNDNNDEVVYQLAKIYDITGDIKSSFESLLKLEKQFPNSKYVSEAQFRIGEYYFANGVYPYAKEYYQKVINSPENDKFYINALYKYAWSQLKLNDYKAAVHAFFQLLDTHYSKGEITQTGLSNSVPDTQKTLINDIIRGINLSIVNDLESTKVHHYFDANPKPYEPYIYQSVAQHLVKKDRLIDATATYFAYLEQHQANETSFQLFNKGVTLLEKSQFLDLYLQSKKTLVTLFSPPQILTAMNPEQAESVSQILAKHNFELAQYYHSLAQNTKRKKQARQHYQLAQQWYDLFLKRFKNNARYGEVSFLLAETYSALGNHLQAAKQYRFTSYQIKPHANSKEAGYAAVLSYQQALAQQKQAAQKQQIQRQLMQASVLFRQHYPKDKRSDKVIFNAASAVFNQKDYAQVLVILEPVQNTPDTSQWLQKQATVLLAHSYFNLKNYNQAAVFYSRATTFKHSKKQRVLIATKLAESYYQMAQQASAKQQPAQATLLFLKAHKLSPSKQVQKIALYDAATQTVIAKNWSKAIALLKQFKRSYPKDKKLFRGAQEKLALAYRSSGDTKQAALAVYELANNSSKAEKKALLWEAARLFKQNNDSKQYLKAYNDYARLYPLPLERSLQARQIIAQYHLNQNNLKIYKQWLNSIVKSERKYRKHSNQIANKLASESSLRLAQYAREDYQKIKLTLPLKRSLQKKKKALKTCIKLFSNTLKYADPEDQAAATYGLGDVYLDFANSLLNSERPKNLNEEELEEYGYLLEDQAFPFEEKAIKIHSRNFANTAKGLYSKGIRQSQQSLVKLLPFQYNKHELISPYVAP